MIDRKLLALVLGVTRIMLIVLLVVVQPRAEGSDHRQEAAATTAIVSFDHLLLRQNESANVDVWLTNSSDRDETVVLSIAGTDLIQWHDGVCPEKPTQASSLNTLVMGKLTARSIMHRPFCGSVVSEVIPGDYNVLFSFQYHSEAPASGGVLAVEKMVRLSFLGTDNIAGIPLAFSCFILPGFFFWAAAQSVGAFKGMGQALGDKTIFSIMISFVIVALASWGTPLSVALGVSIGKLAYLSAIGAVAGLVCGGGERWVQAWRAQVLERRKLNPNDAPDLVVEKLLAMNSSWVRPRVTLTLKKEVREDYIGSLYGKTDTQYVLVGWFQVQVPAGNKKFKDAVTGQQRAEVVGWARKNKTPITQLYPIRHKVGDAAENEDTKWVRWLSIDQVAGVSVEFDQKKDGRDAKDPLEVKEKKDATP
jgi:hypothetical protein